MTLIDYVVLAIVGFSVLLSVLRGFVRELLALAAWVVAFIVARLFGGDLAAIMPSEIPGEELRWPAGFALAILKEQFHIGQGQAGVAATIYWQVAAIVGAVAGGWLADRWMRRNERKQESARFDWQQRRVTLGENRGSFDLTPQAQDLLSFPFHLAMTVREDEAAFRLGVTNGRRFREYTFNNLGRDLVSLRDRQISALHLQGSRENEGALDVWLDLAHSGLPVKVRTQDHKGQTFMLLLQGVTAKGG